MSKEVVIVSAVRTALGSFGGSLKDVPTAELGAIVIKEALNRANVKPEQVDEVFMGCVLQAALGQNVARQSTIKAGLPDTVPALTVNNVCGSGLKCVNMAAAAIIAGDADIVVAGGMENMSAAAYAIPKGRYGYRMGHGQIIDTMISDGLTDAFAGYHMGVTAENIAEKMGITKEEQDAFSAASQQKAEAAQAAGKFKEEITPVMIKVKKDLVPFETDEYIKKGVTAEALAKLKPCFKKEGTVTAASASGINDGAAAVVVMSAEKAKELGITPLAKWVGGASGGVDPAIMGLGPVVSTKKALKNTGLSLDDIDLIEANEAFAVQAIGVGKELGWDSAKVNVNGGAIALGHPVGASGCRILVTLLHEMKRRDDAKKGLATLCVGGGMGVTTIVEKI